MRPLYLASASPRRRALIQLLGRPVKITAVDLDEDSIGPPDPAANVVATAIAKARTASAVAPEEDAVIISADTTVALDGEMLAKPADEEEARQMLRRLRGREHQVHTGIAVLDKGSGQLLTDVATVDVRMRPYTDAEIEAYVATGDPMDKAGAYAIQHREFRPVADLSGCYAAVVGLPLCRLSRTLARLVNPVNTQLTELFRQHDEDDCPVCLELLGRET